MPLSNRPFSFRGQFNWIKVFPLFRTILDSWEVSSKSVWSRKKLPVQTKKKFLFSNLGPRVPSFYKRTKSELKNRVTTVHLLQCKTNFFIRLSLWGEKYTQIKEYPSWETSTNIEKNFFDLFTLVYIRLHSFTFA